MGLFSREGETGPWPITQGNMYVLAVILARAGSRGLPEKCIRPLLGRPLIDYTFDHALAAGTVDSIVLTTDSEPAQRIARGRGIRVVDRPAELASDTATVDAAARHAVRAFEASTQQTVDIVVLLYGNIPVRAEGMIDRAVRQLIESGADSVRSVAPVSKQHPDWVHRLDGDRMNQYRPNSIYRRQDLDPLYYHDGAVAVVRRAALMAAPRWEGDFQGFLGEDRRALVQGPEDAVDIDGPVDLHLAEAILRARGKSEPSQRSTDVTLPDITIGRATIGAGHPVYVIAEAGVNHNGSRDAALEMVDAAAAAGANAVKFQMFRADTLVTPDAVSAGYQQKGTGHRTQRDLLRGLELEADDFAAIQRRCAQQGVEFLATPFALPDLEALVELGVRAVKLASTDLDNVPLVRAAADTGLPLIVSTGAADAVEIDAAVRRLEEWNAAERTILLHCVSSYPTQWNQANLRAIGALTRRCGRHAGYSDHTTSETIGGLAVAAGAQVLEKHFMLDRRAGGPDQATSLEPDQLARYIRGARQAEEALGSGHLDAIEAENEVRRVARKSVVAACDIPAGAVLTAEMVTAKRPGGGLPPSEIDGLIGKCAAVAIPADTQLTWEAVR